MSKEEDYVKIPKELAKLWVANKDTKYMSDDDEDVGLYDAIKPQLKTEEESRAERLGLPWKRVHFEGETVLVGGKVAADCLSPDVAALMVAAPKMAALIEAWLEMGVLKSTKAYREGWDALIIAGWLEEED